LIVRAESKGRLVIGSSAKVNLFLEVLSRREDGYHEIETVFQEIAIFDEVEIELWPGGGGDLDFASDPAGLAPPGENLVERAVRAFRESTGARDPLRVRLRKTIPTGSGLGGGSSNAAAVLAALDRMLGTRLPLSRLEALAASLGSDCAFFLHGGSAIGRGRGERIEPLEDFPPRFFLVFVPPVAVSTATVYAAISPALKAHRSVRRIPLADFQSADLVRFALALHNRLEAAAFERHPELKGAADVLRASGMDPVHLTGSGGGLFAVFDREEEARAAARRLSATAGGSAVRTFVAASLGRC
jgi:4-diphosphocytidyl-2-C-methyl-D-erythritol kinase